MTKSDDKRVPTLRFKGFTDEWEERKLNSFLVEYKKKTKINNQYPVLTSSRQGIFFQKDYYDGNQIASKNNIGYNIVPRNYFTYRHMSDDTIFHFNINTLCDYGIVSTLYPVFTTSNQLSSSWLYYYLNYGNDMKKYALLQKQGGSRTYMYFSKLKNMLGHIPNVKEQDSISKILLKIDNQITLHQRKLDLLKEQKKGYLQKMFPKNGAKVPELRFAGFADDWEQRKFRNLYKKVVEKNDLSFGTNQIISVANMYYKPNESKSDEKYMRTYNIFRLGDIAFEGNKSKNFSYGRFVENTIGDGIVSHVFDVFRPIAEYDLSYWKYFIHYEDIMRQKLRMSTTKATIMNNLVSKDFLKQPVLVPELDEQKQIGTFFKQLDNTIALHQRKLDLLKEQKKGFLQKMFV